MNALASKLDEFPTNGERIEGAIYKVHAMYRTNVISRYQSASVGTYRRSQDLEDLHTAVFRSRT